MKNISVSTDVFAQIWALRRPGEETEDDILRRCLSQLINAEPIPSIPLSAPKIGTSGYLDKRSGVSFDEGFEIFRTYKGVRYTARATYGEWLLENDGQRFRTLNELSKAVVGGNENAWKNWNFSDSTGAIRKVSDLRPTNVVRRKDLMPTTSFPNNSKPPRWVDDVLAAIISLGGIAHLEEIYRTTRSIRNGRGASLPPSTDAIIRKELEYHSSDSDSFQGSDDLFYMSEGKGNGVWGVRQVS